MNHDMKGMEGMDHDMDMMMPGMLAPKQMKEPAAAKGEQFWRLLFLTGMIQHHTGAPHHGGRPSSTHPTSRPGRRALRFATDIDNNTQRAEIRIMQSLLEQRKDHQGRIEDPRIPAPWPPFWHLVLPSLSLAQEPPTPPAPAVRRNVRNRLFQPALRPQ
jgi:hypothetical protein